MPKVRNILYLYFTYTFYQNHFTFWWLKYFPSLPPLFCTYSLPFSLSHIPILDFPLFLQHSLTHSIYYVSIIFLPLNSLSLTTFSPPNPFLPPSLPIPYKILTPFQIKNPQESWKSAIYLHRLASQLHWLWLPGCLASVRSWFLPCIVLYIWAEKKKKINEKWNGEINPQIQTLS